MSGGISTGDIGRHCLTLLPLRVQRATEVVARVPPLLQVRNLLGKEEDAIHPQTRGSKELPSV